MRLGKLIDWLSAQDADAVVTDGFASPHSDRGNYHNLAFDPIERTTLGAMREWAKSAVGATFNGWKGGEFLMDANTECFIGEYGECGEPITSAHLKLWAMTASREAK